MRRLVASFATALVVLSACSRDHKGAAPEQSGSGESALGASRAVVPNGVDLGFLGPDIVGVGRVDLHAVMEVGDENAIGQELRPLFDAIPGCELGLVRELHDVVIGIPHRSSPEDALREAQVQVTGSFAHGHVRQCVEGLAKVAGFAAVAGNDGLRLEGRDGKELTAITWTKSGFVLAPTGWAEHRTGPSPVLKRLLANLDTTSPFWLVVDSSPDDPGGFEELWLEVRVDEGVRLRGAMLARSPEYAENGAREFLGGVVKSAADNGLSLDQEELYRRFGFQRDGNWVRFDAHWTSAEIEAFTTELNAAQQ